MILTQTMVSIQLSLSLQSKIIFALTNHYTDSDAEDDEDFVDKLPPSIYCDLIETLSDKCGEYSILEIWKYERSVIEKLTEQDIVNAINTVEESPVFGYETNFTEYLGGVTRYRVTHLLDENLPLT